MVEEELHDCWENDYLVGRLLCFWFHVLFSVSLVLGLVEVGQGQV